jgi:hypothetical protein
MEKESEEKESER